MALEMGSHATYVAGTQEDWAWLPRRRRAKSIDPAKVISLKDLLEGKVTGRTHAREIFSIGGGEDRKSTRLNSSHIQKSRMPSSA